MTEIQSLFSLRYRRVVAELVTCAECVTCRAVRAMPWWKRLWLSLAYGIKEIHA